MKYFFIHISTSLITILLLYISPAFSQQIPFRTTTSPSEFEQQYDDLRYGREEWNFLQRSYPYNKIPYQKRVQASRKLEQMRQAGGAAGPGWTSIGPANIGGRVNSIAIDPSDKNIVYMGAADGGVWKSTDAGGTWVPLTDDLPSLSMGAIAIDPGNPRIIYMGTGEYNFIHQYGCKPSRSDQYPGEGVFRSTDGGLTWIQAGEKFSDSIVKIEIDPISTEIIYTVSIDGLFKSIDSGNSWTNVLGGITTDLVIDKNSPLILYAAVGKPDGDADNGIYKSTDGGANWTKLGGGLPESEEISRISLTISRSDPDVLYTGIACPGMGNMDKGAVYKTTDGGLTWAITGSGPNPDCYKNVIAVDPSDPDTVYTGELFIYKSTDGGETWVNIDPTISTYVDYHAIAINQNDPQTFYTGNDRGIYKTTDGGETWINLNQGLAITQFYDIAVDPSTESIIYGGCQDNGVLKYLGTDDWIDIDYFNDGGFNAVDYKNPETVYFENQYARIKKSLDGGNTSFSISEGLDTSRTGFVTPFLIDPSAHDRLYLGTYMLHRTTNGGDEWEIISPDLTKNAGEFDSFISAIGVSKINPDLIYIGTSDGNLQVTDDGGLTWNLRTNSLPDRFVASIAVDGESSLTAYAAFSGYGTSHVFMTRDAGQNWKSIDADLPDVPVNSILVGSEEPDTLYIGTDVGVFKSTDRGRSWFSFSEGLPVVVVSDLEANPGTALIRAATMGRSVFEIDETGDVNGDGKIDFQDLFKTIKIILRFPPSPSGGELIRADVNGDGDVGFDDLAGIFNMIHEE